MIRITPASTNLRQTKLNPNILTIVVCGFEDLDALYLNRTTENGSELILIALPLLYS